MNGRKSKACRKLIYGKEGSSRERKYKAAKIKTYSVEVTDKDKESWVKKGYEVVSDGIKNMLNFYRATFVADEKRRAYQKLKRKFRGVK